MIAKVYCMMIMLNCFGIGYHISLKQKEFEEFIFKPGTQYNTSKLFKNYPTITSVCSIIGIFSLGIIIGWFAKDKI